MTPSVFGGNVAGNAFFNLAFRSAETALPLDVPGDRVDGLLA